MNTLVIYDEAGSIISLKSGNVQEPTGIPFIWVEVPEGKRVVNVDVSVETHQAVFEDIPPSKVEGVEDQVADLQYQLMMNGVI